MKRLLRIMTNDIKVKPMKARNKRKEKQQNKKNQAIVNQLAKNSVHEESLTSNDAEEAVTVEEMSFFYVDPITGEIQTISIEQDVST